MVTIPTRTFVHPKTKKTVVLIGMAHIWPPAAFEHVVTQLDSYRARGYDVYHEGVRGDKQRGEGSSLAQALESFYATFKVLEPDFVYQKSIKGIQRKGDYHADITVEEFASALGRIRKRFLVLILRLGARTLPKLDAEELEKILSELMEHALDGRRSFLMRFLQGPLLDRRNNYAIKIALKEKKRNSVLPWGAAHIPGMTDILLKNGFEQVGASQLSL